MDDTQNLTGSTGNSGSGEPAGGIPIKFNFPAPATIPGLIEPQASQPQTVASPPTPPPAPAPAPVTPQTAPSTPPEPPRKIDPRYIMVGILGMIFIVVSVFFYFALVSFMKGEEKIVTLSTQQQTEPLAGAATEQKICVETEIMDEKGNCVCKTNYVKQAGTTACVYDCDDVISQIQDLQKSITTSGSNELSAQLASLQANAQKNNCSLPASLKTNCQQLQDDSLNSLAQKDYYNYYLASRNYIEGDCANKNLNVCDTALAVADLINRVIVSKPPQDIIDQLRTERNTIKDNYYQSPTCSTPSTIVERCEEIKIKYKLDGSTEETVVPTIFGQNTEQLVQAKANLTDPGSVFLDDREFYLQNCVPQQTTQQIEPQTTQQGVPRKIPRIKQ